MSDLASFAGVCSLCGYTGAFQVAESKSIRDQFPCPQCGASARVRDQAALIVDEFGRGRAVSVDQLSRLPRVQALQIYEAGLQGPFAKYLKRIDGYVQSHYWPDRPRGSAFQSIRNEDLCALTFQDETFDLVLTSDVLEHVFDYVRAFQEIWRVLKVGGTHIFSVPTAWPLPEENVVLAELIDNEVHHRREPRYHGHGSGDGSSLLVVTDFGERLLDELEDIGFQTTASRRGTPVFGAHRVLTFVSRKR